MLYHPLLAAIITSNIFLRASIRQYSWSTRSLHFPTPEENGWLLLPSVVKLQEEGSPSTIPACKGDSTCSSSPFCSQYLHRESSKELGQLNYFSHLTSLSSSTGQFSRPKGLLLHVVTAPISSLLVMDRHHGEEVSVHHTYRFIWAKLLQ